MVIPSIMLKLFQYNYLRPRSSYKTFIMLVKYINKPHGTCSREFIRTLDTINDSYILQILATVYI